MDTNLLVLIIIVGIAINCAILYGIIHFAMRVKRQMWNQKHLLNFVIEIAKKLDATGNFEANEIQLKNNSGSDQYLN